MSRVFGNDPGDRGSIPGRVIPKTFKMVLNTYLLNIQHYKVYIKGKVKQSRERSSAPPLHFGVVAIEKGAFGSSPTKGRQLTKCSLNMHSPIFYHHQHHHQTMLTLSLSLSLSICCIAWWGKKEEQYFICLDSVSISNSSIWSINRTLSGATTPGQSGRGSDDSKGVLYNSQISRTGVSQSDCFVSYSGHLLEGGSYPSAKMQSVYSTAPPTGQENSVGWLVGFYGISTFVGHLMPNSLLYIYCHPQTDCFVVSQLFSVARHVEPWKLGSKPAQLYVRLSIIPLSQQAHHVSSGIIRD